MSAAHQMPQAQAERIVAAMVAGSRMANTEPSETDTHPRSDVLINWLGITDPADWKTADTRSSPSAWPSCCIRYPAAPAHSSRKPRLHIKPRHLSPDATPRCTRPRSHHMGTNAERRSRVPRVPRPAGPIRNKASSRSRRCGGARSPECKEQDTAAEGGAPTGCQPSDRCEVTQRDHCYPSAWNRSWNGSG